MTNDFDRSFGHISINLRNSNKQTTVTGFDQSPFRGIDLKPGNPECA